MFLESLELHSKMNEDYISLYQLLSQVYVGLHSQLWSSSMPEYSCHLTAFTIATFILTGSLGKHVLKNMIILMHNLTLIFFPF